MQNHFAVVGKKMEMHYASRQIYQVVHKNQLGLAARFKISYHGSQSFTIENRRADQCNPKLKRLSTVIINL